MAFIYVYIYIYIRYFLGGGIIVYNFWGCFWAQNPGTLVQMYISLEKLFWF